MNSDFHLFTLKHLFYSIICNKIYTSANFCLHGSAKVTLLKQNNFSSSQFKAKVIKVDSLVLQGPKTHVEHIKPTIRMTIP